MENFTTAAECPNVTNLTVYGANPTKATLIDAGNGTYEFARIKMRVDTISNPSSSDWFLVEELEYSMALLRRTRMV